MARKPRSDSKLLNLEEEQQVNIFDWLRSLGYEKARLKIKEEFGIQVSIGALHNFYTLRFEEHQRIRFMKAAAAANAIEKEAEQDFSPHLAKYFGQMAFEAGVDDNPARAEIYLKMAREIKSDIMKAERFQLELRKFAESLKTAQEKGLDALFEDIQGNPEAEQLFFRFRDAVTTAAEDAANG